MGTLLTLAEWLVTFVVDLVDWFVGTDLNPYVTITFDLFEVCYRCTLTFTVWLVGAPMASVFWEIVVLVPPVCLVLKLAIWIKGLVWTGGQA